jgi:hypothetical protein
MSERKPDAVIDLDDVTSAGTQVYAGRQSGREARAAAQLDRLDEAGAIVEIHVPQDAWTMSSSFFGGMFGPSVERYGRDEFLKHYHFVGGDLGEDIAEGIADVESDPVPAL